MIRLHRIVNIGILDKLDSYKYVVPKRLVLKPHRTRQQQSTQHPIHFVVVNGSSDIVEDDVCMVVES